MASLVPRGLSIRPPVRIGATYGSNSLRFPTSLTYQRFQPPVNSVRRISLSSPSLAKPNPSSPPQPTLEVPSPEQSKAVLSKLTARPSGKIGKYSGELLVNAVHNKVLDKIMQDAQWLLKALTNYEVKLALRDRSVPREPLYESLQKQGNLHPLTVQFLGFLYKEKKMPEIGAILSKFVEITKDYNNEADVLVKVAAKPENAKDLDVLVQVLKLVYLKPGAKATVTTVVDPTLLGGFHAQVGDIALDMSLKKRLTARDRQIDTWISTITSWDDLTKGSNNADRYKVHGEYLTKLKEVVEDKRRDKDSDLSLFEEKLRQEEQTFKALQSLPHLHDVMSQLLDLHRAQAVEKTPAKQTELQKKIDEMVEGIAHRVDWDPVLEDWLFSSKVAFWKHKTLKMRDGPLKKVYQKVINLLEGKIHTVEFHLPEEDNLYSFEKLKKLTPKQLAQVPVEEFQKLSLEQMNQLPLAQLQEVLTEELNDYGPNAITFNTDNLEALPQMKPVDADAVLLLINNQLQGEYEVKRFAIEIHLAEKEAAEISLNPPAPVDTFQLAKLPVSELKKQGYLPAAFPASVDENITRLTQKRAKAEQILRDAGLSPLPQLI